MTYVFRPDGLSVCTKQKCNKNIRNLFFSLHGTKNVDECTLHTIHIVGYAVSAGAWAWAGPPAAGASRPPSVRVEWWKGVRKRDNGMRGGVSTHRQAVDGVVELLRHVESVVLRRLNAGVVCEERDRE